jgi:serine/threonine protein kinase
VIGETLGQFKLKKELGRGGFATVYRALQPTLNRDVAIKVLHPEFMRDERALKRFLREAQAIARISHPNIVAVYDYGEYNGRAYLVMEFIAGNTLKQRLGKQVQPRFALDVITALGSALDYAHSKGLVHRDVKPANVLITEDDRIVLSDFGIVRLADDDSSLTRGVIGTPQYMSPEQALGQDVDGRSDLYSLGVVLYEMLAGRVPFRGDSAVATLSMHVTMPVPSAREQNPSLSEGIDRVVRRALAKDPAERYQKGLELTAAFKAAVEEAERPVEPTLVTLQRESANQPQATITVEPQPVTEPSREIGAASESDEPEIDLEVLYRRLRETYERGDYAAVVNLAGRMLQLAPGGFRDVQSMLSAATNELRMRRSTASVELQLNELVEGAESAIAEGRLLTARQMLQQARRVAPSDPRPTELLEQVEHLRREEDLRRRSDSRLETLYQLAQSKIKQDDWRWAANVLRELSELDPNYRDVPQLIVQARHAVREDEGHITPTDVVSLRHLAEQAELEDKWKEALSLWEQVEIQQPSMAGIDQRLSLARHYARIHELNEEASRLVGMGQFQAASEKLDELKALEAEWQAAR